MKMKIEREERKVSWTFFHVGFGKRQMTPGPARPRAGALASIQRPPPPVQNSDFCCDSSRAVEAQVQEGWFCSAAIWPVHPVTQWKIPAWCFPLFCGLSDGLCPSSPWLGVMGLILYPIRSTVYGPQISFFYCGPRISVSMWSWKTWLLFPVFPSSLAPRRSRAFQCSTILNYKLFWYF